MSIGVMTQVFKKSRARLAARLVLLCIADNANDEGVAWPSITLIAQKALVSERQVQRCITKLVEIGELQVYQIEGRLTHTFRVLVGDILSPVEISKKGVKKPRKTVKMSPGGDFLGVSYPYMNHHEPSFESLVSPELPPSSSDNSTSGPAKEDGGNNPVVPKKLTPQQAMIKALADVMGMDDQLQGARLARLATALRKQNYTPSQILNFYGGEGCYWRCDWRGQKGQTPNENTIRETIKSYVDGRNNVNGHNAANRNSGKPVRGHEGALVGEALNEAYAGEERTDRPY